MSVQYTAIFHGCKNDNFQMKIFDIFLIFAQNIDCGYTLEPPQRGGSNEYPQSMFWSKNKKIMYTPVNPSFTIEKWGVRGCSLHGLVFVMDLSNKIFLRSYGSVQIEGNPRTLERTILLKTSIYLRSHKDHKRKTHYDHQHMKHSHVGSRVNQYTFPSQ